ncbi:GNAT family acetyltransferase [Parvibaculum sp.]|uniref:GNAT family acetyltransferase n=1 Tax=Parvibaculum sp. TaxID=2024848 RepID=UPI00351FB057
MPHMDIESGSAAVRPARDGDEAALAALWEACGLTRPWNDPMKDIAFARRGPASDVLVIEREGRIAASAMVGHDGHRGAVYYVAADPAHRGEGLGRAIMAAAEEWLRARGVWKLNLMVRRGNEQAMGFYAGLGYAQDEVAVMSRRLGPHASGGDET